MLGLCGLGVCPGTPILGETLGSDIHWWEYVNMCGGDNRNGIRLGHYSLIQISFNLVQSINLMFISNW